jgi:hypothetical protein
MSSPYDTESTSSIASASSITITSKTESTVVTPNTLRRHFCIVLTNNPRMVRSAGRMLQSVTVNMPVSVTYSVVYHEEKSETENNMHFCLL